MNAALTTLAFIKDPLGPYERFEEFDAELIEAYDRPEPMVAARLVSLGSNLSKRRASAPALLFLACTCETL